MFCPGRVFRLFSAIATAYETDGMREIEDATGASTNCANRLRIESAVLKKSFVERTDGFLFPITAEMPTASTRLGRGDM